MTAPKTGYLYGVGLGPGDPELMTLKAARILRDTRIIAFFSKAGSKGHAHKIMSGHLTDTHIEMPMVYPVTTEFPVSDARYETLMAEFYERMSQQIAQFLSAGDNVAIACVGDPFFYGSFMHIYRRLVDDFPCQVVAGVTSMSGCWTNAGCPVTWGDDILTVLPGTLDKEPLVARLKMTDAAVIMKLGQNLPHVSAALQEAGLYDRAIYVEYGTMEAERIMRLADKTDEDAPYFSLIIVPGNGRQL